MAKPAKGIYGNENNQGSKTLLYFTKCQLNKPDKHLMYHYKAPHTVLRNTTREYETV